MLSAQVICPKCGESCTPPARARKFKCKCGKKLKRPKPVVKCPDCNVVIKQKFFFSSAKCPVCKRKMNVPVSTARPANDRFSVDTTNRLSVQRDPIDSIDSAIFGRSNRLGIRLSRSNPPGLPTTPQFMSEEDRLFMDMLDTMFRENGQEQEATQLETSNTFQESKFYIDPERAGTRMDDRLTPQQQIKAATNGQQQENWSRRCVDNKTMSWHRFMSSAQGKDIDTMLKNWEIDMVSYIDELSDSELMQKIDFLRLLPLEKYERNEMRKLLLTAKQQFHEDNNWLPKIKSILDEYNIDQQSCSSYISYIDRLMAVVWYGPTWFCDGFVRQFKAELELEMMPAQRYLLDIDYGKHGIGYRTIDRMSRRPFQEKVKWLKEKCDANRVDATFSLNVDRRDIINDSFASFENLTTNDLRKKFTVTFKNEAGYDDGGLLREWFDKLAESCFNVNYGLFKYSGVDNICYQINPQSGFANEYHLQYFRFIGRFLGKAIFEQRQVRAHMTQLLFKHILGYPILLDDLEFVDQSIYDNLKLVSEYSTEENKDVADMMLNFCYTISKLGFSEDIELKPGGEEIDVTNSNVQEYIFLISKVHLFESTKPQLASLLRGIYDVIPEVWLSIFDYRELELLLCGLPAINVADWRVNTVYRGVFNSRHSVIRWFWEFIELISQEQRARFLQFSTGTSRVPVTGFKSLQGSRGQVCQFTIESITMSRSVYPIAHTCYNRIDLPQYPNRRELIRRLTQVCEMRNVEFEMQ